MYTYKFGSVAQSVARLLCNRKVPGSNPAEGGKYFLWKYLKLEVGIEILDGRWRQNPLISRQKS